MISQSYERVCVPCIIHTTACGLSLQAAEAEAAAILVITLHTFIFLGCRARLPAVYSAEQCTNAQTQPLTLARLRP